MSTSTAETVAPWVPDDSTFGARLAMIRQHHAWNVKQAALACGITVASWRDWEHGRSPRNWQAKAEQIAQRSGCDFVWLLTGRRPISPWNPDDAGQASLFDGSATPVTSRILDLVR